MIAHQDRNIEISSALIKAVYKRESLAIRLQMQSNNGYEAVLFSLSV